MKNKKSFGRRFAAILVGVSSSISPGIRTRAMKCFYFSNGERREVSKDRKLSWTRSFRGENKRCSPEKNSDEESPGSDASPIFPPKPQNLRVFSFSELRVATKNFNRGQMVGEGGFGCVYKGFIKNLDDPQAKTEVAVKQLNKKGLQGHKEWVTEVHFLGLVEHPNLVKLIGYCAEDDERGIQRLLVYEFMPNKSLETHLFSKTFPVIPWAVRLRIALGAAHGLANLHEELDFQIIFRDFKSSNILLDEDFNPKLSDFGMARQGPEGGISHVSTAVVGTAGYAAPEYIQTGHLTSKSDVFSFGVVLFELLTGRRSMDKNRPKNEQKLLEWVKPHLSDSKKFRQIMDPRLQGQYSLKAAQKVASLAHSCLVKQPRSRPKMSEVVDALKEIIRISEKSSTQSRILSLPVESSTESVSKESLKESTNSNRRIDVLKDKINSGRREDGCHRKWSWAPKLMRIS